MKKIVIHFIAFILIAVLAGCTPATSVPSVVTDSSSVTSGEFSEDMSQVVSFGESNVSSVSESQTLLPSVAPTQTAPSVTVSATATPTPTPEPTKTIAPTPTDIPTPVLKPYSLQAAGDGWIYFIERESDRDRIYKKRADNSRKTLIVEADYYEDEAGNGSYQALSYLRLHNERIYYVVYEHSGTFGGSQNAKVYSVKTDGTDSKVVKWTTERFWIYNNKLYFSRALGGSPDPDENGTFMSDISGENEVKLNDYQALGMDGKAGRFYFIVDYDSEEYGTYSCNFDGSDVTKLTQSVFDYDILYVEPEWIFFRSGGEVSKARYDRTEETVVHE
ncbi:MAG: DUF5050 domain-containing protein [Eubacteriales bacterium]|nr:DUF5050 domain-containing protein [Eubacteriales bacterium]